MAKTWVLDTETKGTGANMVPLESLLRRRGGEPGLATVTLAPQERTPEASDKEPPEPLRFKVTDVLGARELARDVGAGAVVRLLEPMRSVLDARISVWVPSSRRWRLLTLDEHKLMWQFRGRADSDAASSARDPASSRPD
jgi:hypothetical protein